MPADNWYIARDKKKLGPFTTAQMKQMAQSSQLLPSEMVLQDGTTKWKPASQVQEFFPASRPVPPPPPPPIPTEPAEWHFTQNGQQAGPVTWTQLRQRAASGQLLATDMVWKNGMAAWAAVSTIKGLISTPTIAPPLLPSNNPVASVTSPSEPPASPQARFIDNGDNTVTDLKHGLVWIKDLRLVPSFEDVGELVEMDWLTAKETCEQLHYIGNQDWRLCSLPEIKSLADQSDKDSPEGALGVQLLKLWKNFGGNNSFWTASEVKNETAQFWKFYLLGLKIVAAAAGANSGRYALPVRDISSSAAPNSKPGATVTHSHTNEAFVYCERGRQMKEKGKLDEAIADFSKVVRLDPANAEAHVRLANAYIEKRMLDESLAEYKEATRLDKRYADNVSHIEKLISQSKPGATNPQSHLNEALACRKRGEQMQKKGMLDEAISDFSKAIRLDPANANYHTWLAEVYKLKGMLNEYVAEYKWAARLDKKYLDSLASANAYCHALRGKAHLEKGMLDESLAEYKEAALLDKQYADSVTQLAEHYTNRGYDYGEKWLVSKSASDSQNALANFEKALQLDPSNSELQKVYQTVVEGMNTIAAGHTEQPMQDHLQFICPHCLTEYHGDLRVGQQTRCDNCGRVFTVFRYVGDHTKGLLGQLAAPWNPLNWLGKPKCPSCGKRTDEDLGLKESPQRVIDGRRYSSWRRFYSCPSCKVTWKEGGVTED